MKKSILALVLIYIYGLCFYSCYFTTNLVKHTPVVKAEPVIIYSASWCGWCKVAKKFLKDNNVEFVERNFDDAEVRSELANIAKRLGYKGRLNAIPLFIIKNKIILGYSPKEILCLLGRQKCVLQQFERSRTELNEATP